MMDINADGSVNSLLSSFMAVVDDRAVSGSDLWIDQTTGLTVTASARVLGGARGLTLGDLAVAADSMAAAMNGEVLEFSVYENDGATVYAYTVGFEREGRPCMGCVSFVPAPDGTVNVLMTTYGSCAGTADAPLYEMVGVAA